MKHPNGTKVVYNNYPFYLPDDDTLARFKEAFDHTSNADLTAITGKCKTYNSRLGAYLGLAKSPEFRAEQGRSAAEYGNRVRRGEIPKQGPKETKREKRKLKITYMKTNHSIIYDGDRYDLVRETQVTKNGRFRNCLKCGLSRLCEACYEDATCSSLCGIFYPTQGHDKNASIYYVRAEEGRV